MEVSEFIKLVEKNAKPKEEKLVAITNAHNNEFIYVNEALASVFPGLRLLHNKKVLDDIACKLEFRQWP